MKTLAHCGPCTPLKMEVLRILSDIQFQNDISDVDKHIRDLADFSSDRELMRFLSSLDEVMGELRDYGLEPYYDKYDKLEQIRTELQQIQKGLDDGTVEIIDEGAPTKVAQQGNLPFSPDVGSKVRIRGGKHYVGAVGTIRQIIPVPATGGIVTIEFDEPQPHTDNPSQMVEQANIVVMEGGMFEVAIKIKADFSVGDTVINKMTGEQGTVQGFDTIYETGDGGSLPGVRVDFENQGLMWVTDQDELEKLGGKIMADDKKFEKGNLPTLNSPSSKDTAEEAEQTQPHGGPQSGEGTDEKHVLSDRTGQTIADSIRAADEMMGLGGEPDAISDALKEEENPVGVMKNLAPEGSKRTAEEDIQVGDTVKDDFGITLKVLEVGVSTPQTEQATRPGQTGQWLLVQDTSTGEQSHAHSEVVQKVGSKRTAQAFQKGDVVINEAWGIGYVMGVDDQGWPLVDFPEMGMKSMSTAPGDLKKLDLTGSKRTSEGLEKESDHLSDGDKVNVQWGGETLTGVVLSLIPGSEDLYTVFLENGDMENIHGNDMIKIGSLKDGTMFMGESDGRQYSDLPRGRL